MPQTVQRGSFLAHRDQRSSSRPGRNDAILLHVPGRSAKCQLIREQSSIGCAMHLDNGSSHPAAHRDLSSMPTLRSTAPPAAEASGPPQLLPQALPDRLHARGPHAPSFRPFVLNGLEPSHVMLRVSHMMCISRVLSVKQGMLLERRCLLSTWSQWKHSLKLSLPDPSPDSKSRFSDRPGLA